MRAHPVRPALLVLLAACAAPPPDPTASLLLATAWTQTAVERDALCRQVFAAATGAVLAAPRPASGARPLAVIVDIDETVLDNSPYQARLIADRAAFDAASWRAWCRDQKAKAIPGAVAFAQACAARDVTVFYVSNRTVDVEANTRANLAAEGFPLADADGVDVVLLRGEVDEESSKAARRARVAEAFDVIALLGDDLHDFVDAAPTQAARNAVIEANADAFGRRWFVLPNPMYGSFDRALTSGSADPDAARRAALDPAR